MVKLLICFVVSLAAVLAVMPSFIVYLKKLSFRQSVSDYALEDDKKKAGTPIMGGVMFILVPVIVTLVVSFYDGINIEIVTVLLAYVGYGLIGLIDDYLIAVKKNNDGLTPKQKFLMQLGLAVLFFILYINHAKTDVRLLFSNKEIHLGYFYFLLVLFMFTGTSNAVNLTDGMDGLAAGCSIFAVIPFLVFCIVQEKMTVAAFCVSLIGALLGYLYYNKKPARVFMGDTGALALGGVLAALAMITKNELGLIVIGGVFVIETLCVIIQQVAVRTIHKRVFIYTPIHYAFRIKGMAETDIVKMFWIAEALFAVIGLFLCLH